MFYLEKGFHLGWKVSVLPQKRGFILNWKIIVLSRKRGCFELKSQCLAAKKVIFKLDEQGWVPLFPMSEGAGIDSTPGAGIYDIILTISYVFTLQALEVLWELVFMWLLAKLLRTKLDQPLSSPSLLLLLHHFLLVGGTIYI